MRESQGGSPGRGVPTLSIAIGILIRGSEVLVARRKMGTHLGGSWEFPGGKILRGEPLESALHRELLEEVGIRFEKATLIHRQNHSYPDREVSLNFFLCTGIEGEPSGAEGQELRWVSPASLQSLATPEANREVIELLVGQLT